VAFLRLTVASCPRPASGSACYDHDAGRRWATRQAGGRQTSFIGAKSVWRVRNTVHLSTLGIATSRFNDCTFFSTPVERWAEQRRLVAGRDHHQRIQLAAQ
jgi:hypothetical protein